MSARWSDLAVGDELPSLALDITATHIAAGAIATRDFMPVHHDRDYAQAQGAPDIFMNILSTNAHCSRWLTDWAGSDALVRNLSIRLGVPLMPGATLTFSGTLFSGTVSDSEGGVGTYDYVGDTLNFTLVFPEVTYKYSNGEFTDTDNMSGKCQRYQVENSVVSGTWKAIRVKGTATTGNSQKKGVRR